MKSQPTHSNSPPSAPGPSASPNQGALSRQEHRAASTGGARATANAQAALSAALAASGTTTKKEIIDRIAADTHQKRSTVKRTVQAFLDTVIDELSAGNRLELRDFGVFEIRERAARTAQNPKTLERVAVPARKTVKFKVGRLMKESVEEPERPSSPNSHKPVRGARA